MKYHSEPFIPIEPWPPIRRFQVYGQTERSPDRPFDSHSRSAEIFATQGGSFPHRFTAEKRQTFRRVHTEGIQILHDHGIDFTSKDNLVWARNVNGQHTYDNLKEVVDELKKLDAAGGTQAQFRQLLKRFGKAAKRR